MRTGVVGALGATAVLVLAGCGSSGGYANGARPPAPINVSVSLTRDAVHVSPSRVGAGPVILLVANESDSSRSVTLASPDGGGAGCVVRPASSGPINPQGTARVALQLVEGQCRVGVEGDGLRPALLVVGRRRTSAQDQLFQP